MSSLRSWVLLLVSIIALNGRAQSFEKEQEYINDLLTVGFESDEELEFDVDTIVLLSNGYQRVIATVYYDCWGDQCSYTGQGLITPSNDSIPPVLKQVVVLENGDLVLHDDKAVIVSVDWKVKGAYDRVAEFVGSLAVFKENDQYGLISKEGKVVLEASYDYIESADKWGRIATKKEDKWEVISEEDLIQLEEKEEAWDDFMELAPPPVVAIYQPGLYKWGFISLEGEVIQSYKYDDFKFLSNDRIAAEFDGYIGLLGNDGRELSEFKYGEIFDTFMNVMIVSNGGAIATRFGLLKNNGVELASMDYNMISTEPIFSEKLDDHYWVVKKIGAEWGVLSYEGKELAPMIYEKIDVSSYDHPKGLKNGQLIQLFK